MQDRYAGDVGDFGKLGMLRQVTGTGLKVGINWYLTYKPEEHDKEDGKHISYLNNNSFQECDEDLFIALQRVVEGKRNVATLEEAKLIPNAQYYSTILRPGSDKFFSRDSWYENSLLTLAGSDIIFCDPDNGLLVKSVALSSSKSDKYITEKEILVEQYVTIYSFYILFILRELTMLYKVY